MYLDSSRRSFLAAAAPFTASPGALASHGRQEPSFLHGVTSGEPATRISGAFAAFHPLDIR